MLIFVSAAIMKHQASLPLGVTLGRVAALYIGTTSWHRLVNAMRVGYIDQSVSVVQYKERRWFARITRTYTVSFKLSACHPEVFIDTCK